MSLIAGTRLTPQFTGVTVRDSSIIQHLMWLVVFSTVVALALVAGQKASFGCSGYLCLELSQEGMSYVSTEARVGQDGPLPERRKNLVHRKTFALIHKELRVESSSAGGFFGVTVNLPLKREIP